MTYNYNDSDGFLPVPSTQYRRRLDEPRDSESCKALPLRYSSLNTGYDLVFGDIALDVLSGLGRR